MKKTMILASFIVPALYFSQLNFSMKNPIREINLKLHKSQTEKINNTGSSADFVAYKKSKELETYGEDYFLSILNPNKIPILFASGSANFMNVESVPANSVWQSQTVDLWQNIVIKTGNKQISYSIKTNNCYTFFWNSGYRAWDLKKIKCDVYADDKKK